MSSAMVPCKACKKEVAKVAITCPHCGVSSPGLTARAGLTGCLAFALILVIFIVVISSLIGSNDSERPQHTGEPRSADVTAADFGEAWPLTAPAARLYCNAAGERYMAVDGVTYALNGKALSAGMQRPDAVTKAGSVATALTERAGDLCR